MISNLQSQALTQTMMLFTTSAQLMMLVLMSRLPTTRRVRRAHWEHVSATEFLTERTSPRMASSNLRLTLPPFQRTHRIRQGRQDLYLRTTTSPRPLKKPPSDKSSQLSAPLMTKVVEATASFSTCQLMTRDNSMAHLQDSVPCNASSK